MANVHDQERPDRAWTLDLLGHTEAPISKGNIENEPREAVRHR